MTLEQYLDRWQSVHGGHDPRANPMVRHWLSLVLRLGRPVARTGVHPDVVTLASLLVAAAVLAVPPSAGALLVLASGLLDGVDGCVAALQDRVTRWGYLLDSLVDRLCDLLFVGALVLAGAPAELGIACGAGVLLLEYTRARAANAGAGEVGAITVAERPTRVFATALGLISVASVGLWVLAVATGVGLLQLLVAVRRQLATSG